MLVFIFLLILVGGAVGFHFYLKFQRGLPDVSVLKDYRPSLVTTVYSDGGDVVGKFYIEKRVLRPLNEIPDLLVKAFIAIEDARFYHHHGIDLQGITRAFWADLRAKQITQGGSTITQQLAKTLFLSPERKIERKIKEVILALEIEKRFSKDEILELYLNQIYFGAGAYGVEAASETYFDKPVEKLRLSEMATLAALPKSPGRFNPFKHPDESKARRSLVLTRMFAEHFITRAQMEEAKAEPLKLRQKEEEHNDSAYFVEHVRRYLLDQYGSSRLYESGLNVYTTLNLPMQRAAVKAVQEGLRAYDKRHGYRGPLEHIELDTLDWDVQSRLNDQASEGSESLPSGKIYDGLVVEANKKEAWVWVEGELGFLPFDEMKWAKRAVKDPTPDNPDGVRWVEPENVLDVVVPGDRILVRILSYDSKLGAYRLALEQEPQVQGALIAIDPATGEVKAMVGGYDFKKSEFNRAIQAKRQPGSAFKPIIYGAAMEKGFSPATVIIDTPVIFQDPSMETKWKPANYSERFYGPTRLRVALAKSRNVVTVKLLQKVGIRNVVRFARKLGIESPLAKDYSLALGSSVLSLSELASAYSVYDNHGMRARPYFIRRILDYDGNVIRENHPSVEKAMDPETAYIVTDMLEEVVRHGTGRRMQKLGRPSAGKTGTTNNYLDALYVGFVPNLVTAVWVGFDDMRTLGKGEFGARAAGPIWLDFMKDALKGREKLPFTVPPGVIFVRVDKKTGLLPSGGEKTYFECFRTGREPHEYAPVKKTQGTNFFDMDSKGLQPAPPPENPAPATGRSGTGTL
ncbi:MAG: penicillin-binding protein 1A [Deltaproteobacteria bacterium]|nr:penicillin-binding protein 1A [Deltaproteobacteria bacterium]